MSIRHTRFSGGCWETLRVICKGHANASSFAAITAEKGVWENKLKVQLTVIGTSLAVSHVSNLRLNRSTVWVAFS